MSDVPFAESRASMDDGPSTAGCNVAVQGDAGYKLGTKDSALIGIICSRTPSQLYAIKQAYQTMYRRTLEHHIDGDTSGDYRKVSERNKI